MYKSILIYILLIILSIPAILPFFNEGFFSMHDDTQVVRVAQMYKALVDGQFPVRWVADLGYGYGYPLFNFYGPLPYYFGALCMFLGASALVATKIMFIVGIIGASISMFLLAKNIWGTLPGIVAAVLYQYAPYHAVDIYVRGAVGEFWAIAILPLVFLGIVLLEKRGLEKKATAKNLLWPFLITSSSYAALILTHNITAMITSVYLGIGIVGTVLYGCFRYLVHGTYPQRLIVKLSAVILSLIVGLGLSASFWVPAFFESSYTNVNAVIGASADYHDHFVYLDQLWDSTWGFGGSVLSKADGMSFKVGKIGIVLASFSLIFLGWQLWSKSASRRLIVYSVCIVLITLTAIFMTNTISSIIWDSISTFAFIQYPWRFLLFIVFGISLLSAGLFTIKKDIFVFVLSSLLIILIIFVNAKYFAPQNYLILSTRDYASNQYVKWYASRISDEYMPKFFVKPTSVSELQTNKFVFNPFVNIETSKITTDKYVLQYQSEQESFLHVNLAYFPGWTARLDGKSFPFIVLSDGIQLKIPQGRHVLEIMRTDTLLERSANGISLFCLIIIFGTMMRLKYAYVKKNKR
jgi:hypothetical protein